MADNDFLPLDPLLNNELRLAIMSILMSADSADFTYIKNTTKATSVGKGEVYKGEERLQGQSSPNRLPYNPTRNTSIGKPRAGVKVVFKFKHIIIVLK